MTLAELAADYFAKSDAYKALVAMPEPTELNARMAHHCAKESALEAAVEASLKFAAARKAQENAA